MPTRAGSSPRVRGTGSCPGRARRGTRFIPARAGNSWHDHVAPGLPPVHPRACGEQPHSRRLSPVHCGSSPRVRGTVLFWLVVAGWMRFIPARAGNSAAGRVVRQGATVHPRACGEQSNSIPASRIISGSSPRVRGTDASVPSQIAVWRFIPARAGNRLLAPAMYSTDSVHPRACGEQVAVTSELYIPVGSSPRVRGTGQVSPRHASRPRFIPARAGNRAAGRNGRSCPRVHPRACGEQNEIEGSYEVQNGSSPRVRGTDPAPPFRGDHVRFIPARAGNSMAAQDREVDTAVHPRACGEQCCD